VGVIEYLGEFEKGEVIEILDASRNPIAVARARYSKVELQQANQGMEVAHADDIVLY
jgi:glutamate 5-kinase